LEKIKIRCRKKVRTERIRKSLYKGILGKKDGVAGNIIAQDENPGVKGKGKLKIKRLPFRGLKEGRSQENRMAKE